MSSVDVDLVAFDLGGTTVQDRGDVPAAFTAALDVHGLRVRDDALSRLRGRSKREALARLVMTHDAEAAPDAITARVEAIHTTFVEMLIDRFDREGVHPVAGAAETLRWLGARAIKIALTTGFERPVAQAILDRLHWAPPLFDALVCADEVAVGRPAPFLLFRAMERTRAVRARKVMAVGDTEADLLAAANAGVGYGVGVVTGAHSRDRLASRPHTVILDSVADLPGLWTRDAGPAR